MRITLEFLGTGTSGGVPIIGCTCDVCTSPAEHDTRLRSSVLLHTQEKYILIDTSPDFRVQMLRAIPPRIDAVLYTHMHADHTAGLDDLRPFNYRQRQRIPAYVPSNAVEDIRQRFGYALVDPQERWGTVPNIELHVIDEIKPFDVAGISITPIPIMHGQLPILGYRFGDLTYLTDVKSVPAESWPLLEGTRYLVTTALKIEEVGVHMNLEEALAFAAKLSPEHTWLSHIGHQLGRESDIAPLLPDNVSLAYDGLVIEAGRP